MPLPLFVLLALASSGGAVNWNGNSWANACDFRGGDLSSAQVASSACGGKCAATAGCTHYTWTNVNGGTCWMKSGPAAKSDAFDTSDGSAVCGVVPVNWNGNNWALGCDFRGGGLASAQVPGDQCGGRCAGTSGCTHFTWTRYSGGTCWMKSGAVSQSDAVTTGDSSMVCGITDSNNNNNNNNAVQTGVLTTFHGATESGACMLPKESYPSSVHPVALGDLASLGYLRYTNGLCGHVLRLDCGNGPVSLIVSNSNLGGGLDLYASSWKLATANAPPGQKWCSVQLTSQNTFTFSGPKCYYEPNSEKSNDYYKLLGLFNTGDKVVVSASLNGRSGAFNGVQPYFAFSFGPIPQSAVVQFNYKDGSSYTVKLADCAKPNSAHIWS